jgi:hypothetical protein
MQTVPRLLSRKEFLTAISLLLTLCAISPVRGQEKEKPSLQCTVGPVEKVFGGNQWNVFSCSDKMTVAIVSTKSSPANPFYFVFYPKGDGYGLSGEGNGQKSATQPAFDELKSLSTVAIRELIAETQKAAPSREVNITADSAPGWVPSTEQERDALETMRKFYAAADEGRYQDAYKFFVDNNAVTYSEFSKLGAMFHLKSGTLKERSVLKVTWSKDPTSQAASPGVYATVDLASKFENIDRHCGFIVLFQKPSGDFSVMREESNYLDNVTAASIAKSKSVQDVEAMWAQMSRNCPNYPGVDKSP